MPFAIHAVRFNTGDILRRERTGTGLSVSAVGVCAELGRSLAQRLDRLVVRLGR